MNGVNRNGRQSPESIKALNRLLTLLQYSLASYLPVLSATQQWSCGQIEQAPREVSKSFLLRARPHDRSDFVPEDLAL